MAFITECPFCRIKLQNVPDRREGDSTECPRCHNLFTLAIMICPPKLRVFSPKVIVPPKTAAPASTGSPVPAMVSASPAPPSLVPGAIDHAASANSAATLAKPAARGVETMVHAAVVDLEALPSSGSRRGIAVAAFLLGGLAVCAATIFHLFYLVLVLGSAGVLCSIVAIAVAAKEKESVSALPRFGFIVNSAMVVLLLLWPSMLGIPSSGLKDLTEGAGQITVLPRPDPAKGKHSAVQEPPWVDAVQGSVEQDSIRVQIVSALLKPVEVIDDKGKKSAREKDLLITVRMSNLGLARSIAYTSWGDAGPAAATLNDNRGRGYKLQGFGHDVEVVGHASRATLAPGKFIEDVLVYPPPVADADLLRLELPGAALGLPGMFRFEIPRKMITFK